MLSGTLRLAPPTTHSLHARLALDVSAVPRQLMRRWHDKTSVAKRGSHPLHQSEGGCSSAPGFLLSDGMVAVLKHAQRHYVGGRPASPQGQLVRRAADYFVALATRIHRVSAYLRWLLLGIQGSFRRRRHAHTREMTISTPRWSLRRSCARWSSATTPSARNGRGMQSAPLAICKQRRTGSHPTHGKPREACAHRLETGWGRGRHLCHAAPGAPVIF